MKVLRRRSIAIVWIALLCLPLVAQQTGESKDSTPVGAATKSSFHAGTIGVGAKLVNTIVATDQDVRKAGVGTAIGFGGDVAVSLNRRSNVRVGFNVASVSRSISRDGITFHGDLRLRSAQALFDFFPFAEFHLSPGLMFYNGNNLDATASTAAGQSFTIAGMSYTSGTGSPITAKGKLTMDPVAPVFLIGYGNLIPRSGRHLSFLAEVGLAHQGMPKVRLDFSGNACDASGANCINAASNPVFLANVRAEEAKLRHDASAFRFLPTVSVGIGYRFGGKR